MDSAFDILVIGAGVVGNAVTRELCRRRVRVGVVEAAPDLCAGTSGRNSGVLHAGFNNTPGTKMAKFCVAGNRGFDALAAELDVPLRRTGKLVVGFTPDDHEQLEAMIARGKENGVPGLELVGREFIREKAPAVAGDFAMWSPSTAILDPFQLTIGLAENAAKNGAQYFFRSLVTAIARTEHGYTVTAGKHTLTARWIVNCAGLGAARIAELLGIGGYQLHPCRGEYFILDKRVGPLLPLPAYPVPNYKTGGLGIHLTPTIDGNVLIGPSTEYIPRDDDYSSTQKIQDLLLADGARIFPHIRREHFIRNFAGIRPKLAAKSEGGYHDFVIERRAQAPHAINLVGIESPGLTSCLPIAREVIRLIEEVEPLEKNPAFDPIRRRIVTFRDKTPAEQAALIAADPDYGEVICRCEGITRAEVLAALRGPLPAQTMSGIKYRCRAMMGRCQGGYCQTRLAELLMQELGIPREEVLYKYEDSYLFTGEVQPL